MGKSEQDDLKWFRQRILSGLGLTEEDMRKYEGMTTTLKSMQSLETFEKRRIDEMRELLKKAVLAKRNG